MDGLLKVLRAAGYGFGAILAFNVAFTCIEQGLKLTKAAEPELPDTAVADTVIAGEKSFGFAPAEARRGAGTGV